MDTQTTPVPLSIYALAAVIDERARDMPPDSYTAKLLMEGVEKCGKKLGEEAVELALAAQRGDRKDIIGEAADVIYHLLVTLKVSGVPLGEIENELGLRNLQMSGNPKSDRRGT